MSKIGSYLNGRLVFVFLIFYKKIKIFVRSPIFDQNLFFSFFGHPDDQK
jgi:hypothetical protein